MPKASAFGNRSTGASRPQTSVALRHLPRAWQGRAVLAQAM